MERLGSTYEENDYIENENADENDVLLDTIGIDRYWSEIPDKNMSSVEPFLRRRANTTSQIAIVGSSVCPIESLDYE